MRNCVNALQRTRYEERQTSHGAVRDVTQSLVHCDRRVFLPFFTWMNRTDDAQHASLFGPPSESIAIDGFLDSVEHVANGDVGTLGISLVAPDKSSIKGWSDWLQLSYERRAAVEAECRYDSIRLQVSL
jgi:hypothetical protein